MVERIPVVDYMHTHPNCRCVMVPVAKSWTELGYPEVDAAIADGTLPAPTEPKNGEDALSKMPKATQQRILGLGRWGAWKGAKNRPGIPNGVGLNLTDMMHDLYDADWGWMLRMENFDDVLDTFEARYGIDLTQTVRENRYPPKPVVTPVTQHVVTPVYSGPLNQTTVDSITEGWRMEIWTDMVDTVGEDIAPQSPFDPQVTQSVDAVNQHLADLVKDTEVRIRVPESVLGSILADGQVKSQFETDTSQGVLNPATRARAEDLMFYPDAAPENDQRPIYGYLSSPNGDESSAQAYGDIVVRLKSDVRARTTITFGDSLYSSLDGSTTATPLVAPTVASLYAPNDRVRDVLGWKAPVEDLDSTFYVEAQVHGQVLLDDIAEVVFTSGVDLPNAQRSALIAQLRALGVPYREAPEWDYERNRREPLTPVDKLRPVAGAPPAVARETRLPAKPKAKAPAPTYGPTVRLVDEYISDAATMPLLDFEAGTTPAQRGEAVSLAATKVEQSTDAVIEAANRKRQGLSVTVDQSRALDAYAMAIIEVTQWTTGEPAPYVPAAADLRYVRPKDPQRAAIYDTALVARSAIADVLGVNPSTSKWTGDINIESNSFPRTGSFSWDGTLSIRQATSDSIPRRVATVVHETLHSMSNSTPYAYQGWPGWEEGVAEAMTRLLIPRVAETMGYDGAAILDVTEGGYVEYTAALDAMQRALGMDPMEFYAGLLRTPLAERAKQVATWADEADLAPADWPTMFEHMRELDLANPFSLPGTHETRRQDRRFEAMQIADLTEQVRDILGMDARTFYRPLLGMTRSVLGETLRGRAQQAADILRATGDEVDRERSNELLARFQGGVVTVGEEGRGVLLGTRRLEGRSPDLATVARQTYEAAARAEPAITADITSIAGDLGARANFLGALQYRLKSDASLRRKIAQDARIDHVTFAQAAANLKDTVRYTYVIPAATYTQTYHDTIAAFEAKGYTLLRTKNFWGHPPPVYQGLNSVLVAPDGTHFELQFHTQASLRVKEANHTLKDEFDALFNDAVARAGLTADMTESERYMAIRAVLTIEERTLLDSLTDAMRAAEAEVPHPPAVADIRAPEAVMLGPEVAPIEQRPAAMDAGVVARERDTFRATLDRLNLPDARPTLEGVTPDGWLVVRGLQYDVLYDAASAVAFWDKSRERIEYDQGAYVTNHPFREVFTGRPVDYGRYQYAYTAPVEWGPEPTVVTERSSFENVRDIYIAEGWWTGEPLTAVPLLTNFPADQRQGAYGHYDADGRLDGILQVHFANGQTGVVDSTLAYVLPATSDAVVDLLREAARSDGLLDHPPTDQQVDATIEADSDRGPEPSVFFEHDAWTTHLSNLVGGPDGRHSLQGYGIRRLVAPSYYVGASTTQRAFDGTNGLMGYGFYSDAGDLVATYFADFVDGRAQSALMWTDGGTQGQRDFYAQEFRQTMFLNGLTRAAPEAGLQQPFLQPLPHGIEPDTMLNSPEDWAVVTNMVEGRGAQMTNRPPSDVRIVVQGDPDVGLHLYAQTDERGDVIAVLAVRDDPGGGFVTMNPGTVTFRPAYENRDVLDPATVRYIADSLRRFAISRDRMDPDVMTSADLTPAPVAPGVETILRDANMVILPDRAMGGWVASADTRLDLSEALRAASIPERGEPGSVVAARNDTFGSTIYAIYLGGTGSDAGTLSDRYAERFSDGSMTLHHWARDSGNIDYSERFFEGVISVDQGSPVTPTAALTAPQARANLVAVLPSNDFVLNLAQRGFEDDLANLAAHVDMSLIQPHTPVVMLNSEDAVVYLLRDANDTPTAILTIDPNVLTGFFTADSRALGWAGVVTAASILAGRAQVDFPNLNVHPTPVVSPASVTLPSDPTKAQPAPVDRAQPQTVGTWSSFVGIDLSPETHVEEYDASSMAGYATNGPVHIPLHAPGDPTRYEVYDLGEGGRHIIVDRWQGDIVGLGGVRPDGVLINAFFETGALSADQRDARARQMTELARSIHEVYDAAPPTWTPPPVNEDELPDVSPRADIRRPTETDWTTDYILGTARDSLTAPSLMGAADGVYWGRDAHDDWVAFSVVSGEVVAAAVFDNGVHTGFYVNPFNTSGPTDAAVRGSFDSDNPTREIAGQRAAPTAPTTTPSPSANLTRDSQHDFDLLARPYTVRPWVTTPNTVYDLGAGVRGYFNDDSALVLIRFADGTVHASPAVTNTDDAEMVGIFNVMAARTPAAAPGQVINLSIEEYRHRLAPIAHILPPHSARPLNTVQNYTDPATGTWRVFFDDSGYASALQQPDGSFLTYTGWSEGRLRTIFSMPSGMPITVTPVFTPPPPAAVTGPGFRGMPTDYDFNTTTVRNVAEGLVADGVIDNIYEVLDGPPLTARFVGVYNQYGDDAEGGFYFYGPTGGVVSSAWCQMTKGGDVTANNPDGWKVASVHYVKTHEKYRRNGYATRMYEWATINGFRIEKESGLHGLTGEGTRYFHERQAKPFSRISMGISRMRPELGTPTTYDDIIGLRGRKAIRDSTANLPGELRDAGVSLVPTDAPLTYTQGATGDVRLIPHTEETVGLYAGVPEPSQSIEIDPVTATVDDIDFAAAYSVRRNKQDSTVVTLVGDAAERLYGKGFENGQSFRIEGFASEKTREVYDAIEEAVASGLLPGATIHDTGGRGAMVEVSIYTVDMTDERLEALRHIAAIAGGKLKAIPAHITFYWHDAATEKAARDGWFDGPDDASVTADAVKERLRAAGQAERAKRIGRRRRTVTGQAGGDGGAAAASGGPGAVAGDVAGPGDTGGAVPSLPRSGPRGTPLTVPTDVDARQVHDDAVATLAAIEAATGLTNARWTGDVEIVPYDPMDPNVGTLAWDGVLRLAEDASDSPYYHFILIHELLHATSGDCNPDSFLVDRWLEEGVVEAVAVMLTRAAGSPTLPSQMDPYLEMTNALEAVRGLVGVPTRTFYSKLVEANLSDRARLITDWVEQRATAPHAMRDWARIRFAQTFPGKSDAALRAFDEGFEAMRDRLGWTEARFYAEMGRCENLLVWLNETSDLSFAATQPALPRIEPTSAWLRPEWRRGRNRPHERRGGGGGEEPVPVPLARTFTSEDNVAQKEPVNAVQPTIPTPAPVGPRQRLASRHRGAVQRGRLPVARVPRRRA